MSFALPPHPYPPDVYTGEGGEVSAWFAPPGRGPDAGAEYLATGADTGGKFGLYRWNMGPGQGGPDEHFHRAISESFYILSGTITICTGDRWVPARTGDFAYVPEGGIHGFRNDSDEPASMLILFSPGAPRERYFEGLVERRTMSVQPTDEELAEFFAKHDTYWI